MPRRRCPAWPTTSWVPAFVPRSPVSSSEIEHRSKEITRVFLSPSFKVVRFSWTRAEYHRNPSLLPCTRSQSPTHRTIPSRTPRGFHPIPSSFLEEIPLLEPRGCPGTLRQDLGDHLSVTGHPREQHGLRLDRAAGTRVASSKPEFKMYELMDTPEWKALQKERQKIYEEQQRESKNRKPPVLSDLDLALMKDRLETHQRVEEDDDCWPTEGPISSGFERYHCQEVCTLGLFGRKTKECWEACDLVDKSLLKATPGFESFYVEKKQEQWKDLWSGFSRRTRRWFFSLAEQLKPP